jgi:hypothetical protein
MNCQLAKGIHDGCHIDAIRTLAGAGMATHTEPDGVAPERIVSSPHLDQADDLVGHKVHMSGEGTSPGACPAMPAHADVLPGQMIDDFQESVRMTIGVVVRFKAVVLVDHVSPFPWQRHNFQNWIAFTPAKTAWFWWRPSHNFTMLALTYVNCFYGCTCHVGASSRHIM